MTALPEVLQWCAASDKVKSNTLSFPTIRYGVTDFAGFIQICHGVPRIAIPLFFQRLKKFVKIMRMYEKKYNKNDKDC